MVIPTGTRRAHQGSRFQGRPQRFNHLPFNYKYDKPVIDPNPDWRSRPEVTVRLSNLPRDVDTKDIYDLVQRFGGTIVKIKIIQNENYPNNLAYVDFSPPPREAFWLHQYVATVPNSINKIEAELSKDKILAAPAGDSDGPAYSSAELGFAADELAFGIMETENQFTAMRTLRPSSDGPIALKLDREHKEMHVFFRIPASTLGETIEASDASDSASGGSANSSPQRASGHSIEYMLTVPFKQLKKVWVRQRGGEIAHLVIPCEGPGRLFRKIADPSSTMAPEEKFWQARKAWFRDTDVVSRAQGMARANEPLALDKKDPFLDFGSWTVLAVQTPASWPSSGRAGSFSDLLEEFNVSVYAHSQLDFKAPASRVPLVWTHLGDYDGNREVDAAERVKLSWPVRYQFEASMSQNVINPWNVTLEFLKTLSTLPEHKVLRMLEYATDTGKRIYNPMELFAKRIPAGHGIKRVPPYCVLQRAVNITPSCVHFSSPTVEVSNRMIRQWHPYADRFLRVRFSDEKLEGKLYSSDDENNNIIFNRVRRCLQSGITIGNRHYEYLASGNSQMREHGAYFFAKAPGCDPAQIRYGMGDFRGIKIPAKYAARMGQCFSTTRAINSLNVKFCETPDVERNGYNFTDGVGKISPFLAKMIASELRMPTVASAYQFRLGGCKGVLSVWPEVDSANVHIRKSQYKFPSGHIGLEIIKGATFIWGQLNRQLITNLQCLGVPSSTFVSKMERQLRGVDNAVLDKDKALEQLERRIDANYVTLTIAEMVRSGFMETAEPFTMAVLNLWRSWTHKQLKEKASIHIEKAAFLMGVSDEAGVLRGHSDSEPDRLPQIFLQTRHPVTNVLSVVTGTCAVMRNPTLHPGDVRIVKAVDKKELHHLINVVVFSQLGDRDVPSMCSGGDLDGDDFFVTWDDKIIPKQGHRNYPPMQQLGSDAQKVEEVKLQDIIDFTVTYMKQDSLGRIANGWQALADKLHESGGPKHPDCVRLAQEHSIAVDFLKTGTPASSKLVSSLVPAEYPHFMENPRKREYKSTSACGQLFDRVDLVAFVPRVDNPFDRRVLTFYTDLPNNLLLQAKKIKGAYDSAIDRIMNQYEIQTEFEVCTSFILQHSRIVGAYELHTNVADLYEQVKQQYTQEIITLVGGSEQPKLWPFVCAMYQVTADAVASAVTAQLNAGYEEVDQQLLPKISYPWLFSRELGKIARHHDFISHHQQRAAELQKSQAKQDEPDQGQAVDREDPSSQATADSAAAQYQDHRDAQQPPDGLSASSSGAPARSSDNHILNENDNVDGSGVADEEERSSSSSDDDDDDDDEPTDRLKILEQLTL